MRSPSLFLLASLALASLAGCGTSPPPEPVSTTRTTAAALTIQGVQDPTVHQRVVDATKVLADAVGNDGKKIPEEVAARTDCVGVIPSFVHGGRVQPGQEAHGIVTCRTASGWSKPGFFVAKAGSGTPKPLEPTIADVIVLGGAGAGSKPAFLGSGPRATLTCYGRSDVAFDGIELGGMSVRPDAPALRYYHQREVSLPQVLSEPADGSPETAAFIALVARTFDRGQQAR